MNAGHRGSHRTINMIVYLEAIHVAYIVRKEENVYNHNLNYVLIEVGFCFFFNISW